MIFIAIQAHGQELSLFFVGDTGKDTIPPETLYLLEVEAKLAGNSVIVFLGDNVYPRGNQPNHAARHPATRTLLNQLDVFDQYAGQLYVTSGNHDWANGKPKGLDNMRTQASLVNEWKKNYPAIANQDVYQPDANSAGPVRVEVHPQLSLIFIHSQAYLQRGRRKVPDASPDNLRTQLEIQLNECAEKGQHGIIIAHHPIYSNGKHAASLQPWRFLLQYTPLQVFGLAGLNQVFRQNIRHPRYRRYAKSITEVMEHFENVVYISGHDHNMQHIPKDGNHFIISGSGSKQERIGHYYHKARMMEDRLQGFVRLKMLDQGQVILTAHSTKYRGEFTRYRLLEEPLKRKLSAQDSLSNSHETLK